MPSFTVPAFTLYDASGNPITSRALGNDTKRFLDVTVANGDRYLTGQGSQVTLNNNILLEVAGASSLDIQGFRSMLIQVVVAAGTVTAGVIRFQQSNDNANWFTLPYVSGDNIQTTTALVYTNYTVPAGGNYTSFYCEPRMRYVKVYISTGITGTSAGVQAFTTLSPQLMNLPVLVKTVSYDDLLTTPAGNVAHDAADSGNPIKTGAKAIASLKTATMVADADRTNNVSDLDGTIVVRQDRPLGDLISERVTDTGGSSTAFTNFSAVASTRNYVDTITISNSSATDGTVDFRDGAAGAVLWTVPIPKGAGVVIAPGKAFFRTSANTALAYDVSAALTTVIICVSGFQSKV